MPPGKDGKGSAFAGRCDRLSTDQDFIDEDECLAARPEMPVGQGAVIPGPYAQVAAFRGLEFPAEVADVHPGPPVAHLVAHPQDLAEAVIRITDWFAR